MKILFVYRGYGSDLSNSVIDFQRNALEKAGLEIDIFPIKTGGINGYLCSLISLHSLIKKSHYDIIHAHYSYSGYIAAMATRKHVVCSLMGSDFLQHNILGKLLVKIFSRFLWRAVIVKSREMQEKVPGSICIPNGVDFDNFQPDKQAGAVKQTGFESACKNIIFVAQQPESHVKNLELARKAIALINDEKIRFHIVSNICFEDLPGYYNAADLLLLTSLSEGSPNVIKEAMACNCPIVATDVGDIREVIGNTEGCFLTDFDPRDVAEKIEKALDFGTRTSGRENIKHLDNKIIAERIIRVYKDVLEKT